MSIFKKAAEAALAEVDRLTAEARSVDANADLSADEKRSKIDGLNADIAAKIAEARSAVESAEAEAEARSLGERMGKVVVPVEKPEGDEGRDGTDLDAEIRALSHPADKVEIQASSEFRAAGTNTAKLTDSAWAGTTVQNKFVAEVIQAMRDVSPILQAGVKIISTSTGEKIEWPVKNGSIIAAAVAEGATYGKSKGSFTRWSIDAYKYGVIAEGTYEMLNDSTLGLASIIAEDIGASLADVTNADFLRGNGTTAPHGIVNATVLNTTLANAAAITTDALVTFTHSIKPQYRAKAKWYVSDDFVLKVRLLKDGQGRYVWQDSLTAGAPSTLLGYPVVIDPYMDGTVGAAKVPVVFGDFSKFLVRFVGSVTLSRSDEYGWDSDIVAWKGSVRVDSGLTDAAALAKITMTA